MTRFAPRPTVTVSLDRPPLRIQGRVPPKQFRPSGHKPKRVENDMRKRTWHLYPDGTVSVRAGMFGWRETVGYRRVMRGGVKLNRSSKTDWTRNARSAGVRCVYHATEAEAFEAIATETP